MLIRIGDYQAGSDPELDEAIGRKEWIEDFLKQDEQELLEFETTKTKLLEIL